MENEFVKLRLPYEFIEGVDGRLFKKDELNKVYSKWRTIFRYGHPLLLAEVGCAMSHIKFYERFLTSTAQVGFVFEDDVVFNGNETAEAIGEVKQFLENTKIPAMVEFPAREKDFPKKYMNTIGNLGLVKSTNGTYAYGINRAAAKMLLATFKIIKMPIDHYSYIVKRYGLKIYLYRKQVTSFNDTPSLISAERHLYMGKIAYAFYKLYRCFGMLIDAILSMRENYEIRHIH